MTLFLELELKDYVKSSLVLQRKAIRSGSRIAARYCLRWIWRRGRRFWTLMY